MHIEESQAIATVQAIYNHHKTKLENMKENRSRWEEERWSDDEVRSVDEQIVLLASILSDLYRKVLNCR